MADCENVFTGKAAGKILEAITHSDRPRACDPLSPRTTALGRLEEMCAKRASGASASALCSRERTKPGWADMIRAFSPYTSTKYAASSAGTV